jgi:predicted DNA-binding ribbon-helix-helix protein
MALSGTKSQRRLLLRFDTFGWLSLEERAKAVGMPVSELVARAAAYYRADLGSRRFARRVAPDSDWGEPAGRARRLQLKLDLVVWQDLEEEAARQEVSLERLLEHAAMYLLGDLDSGRASESTLTRPFEENP